MKDKLIEFAILNGFGFAVGFLFHSFLDNAILREVRAERDSLREEVKRWRSAWAPR